MSNIDELDEMAQRLRVSWRKAHNYYRSFGTQFLEIKEQFDRGDYPGWTFSSWLLKKAGMFEEQVMTQMKVFARSLADADREKLAQENARIDAERRAQKAREEAERRAVIAEKRAAKAHAKREKEQLQAEREAQRAAERAAKEAKAAEKQANRDKAKEAEKQAAKRLADRRRYQERKAAAAAAAAVAAAVGGEAGAGDGLSLDQLALRIIVGKGKAERGRVDEIAARQMWVEGTMEVAVALADAKDMFPAVAAFGRWLTEKGIDYNKNDRAALINMGRIPDEAEAALKNTSRTSYETIWKKEILPTLADGQVPKLRNMAIFEEIEETADPLGDNVVPLRGSV